MNTLKINNIGIYASMVCEGHVTVLIDRPSTDFSLFQVTDFIWIPYQISVGSDLLTCPGFCDSLDDASQWWQWIQWIRWNKLPCEYKNSNYFAFPPFLGIICYSQRSLSSTSSGFSENRLLIIYYFASVAGVFYFKTKFEDTVIYGWRIQ